jgi:hypothetical protein
VISQRHIHFSLKYTGGYADVTFLAESPYKVIVNPARFIGWSCLGEIGPAAFPAIAVESELGDHQQLAARLQKAPIHPSFVVSEHAQVNYLVREIVGIRLAVAASNTHQYYESRADLSHNFSAHCYTGLTYSL